MNYFDWAMASIAAILSLPGRVIFFEVNPFGGWARPFSKNPFNSPNWDRLNRCGNTLFSRFFLGWTKTLWKVPEPKKTLLKNTKVSNVLVTDSFWHLKFWWMLTGGKKALKNYTETVAVNNESLDFQVRHGRKIPSRLGISSLQFPDRKSDP